MAQRFTGKKSDGIISILSLLILIITSTLATASPQSQQLTQAEFSQEIRNAYIQNDDQLADSLIKDHRLLVKPFVNDLITESIRKELKGNTAESKQATGMAEKTAASFEKIFGENSLTLGVSYLKSWSKEQKEKKLVGDSLYALGTSIRGNAQDREKAIEIHQQALDTYKEIGDERGEAEVLGGLGLICTFKNDYQTALSYYREALIKREKVDDRLLIGNTVNSMGSIYYGIIKDYRIALPYFDRAEAIRTGLGDSLNLGRTILLKASTLDNLGQFKVSLEYYKRACELNQASGDQARVAESLLKAGTVLNNLDKYPEALESLNKALGINKAINKSSGISEALNQIGYVYLKLGDLNKALDKFNEAIKITKDQNDKWGLAGIYNNLGIMLQDAGRIEKALEYYNNALSIFEELGDQASVLILLGNIGTINFDLKDYAKSEEYHLKGLKISRDLNSKDQEAKNLLNLANSQVFLGKFDEAMSNYNAGLKIAQSLNSPELIWKITAGMAETWERQGNYEKAVELNDTVLKIIEGMRTTLESDEQKSSFMASERYVFEDVINLLSMLHEKNGTKGYDKLAFQYTEQSKSRAFLDLLAESLANVKEGENNELLNKQDEILTGLTRAKQFLEQESKTEKPDQLKISGLKEKINTTEEELDKIQQEIRKTNPRYADLHYPQPVSLEEVKALCPDKNTVILEYSVGDSSSCLWVITQSAHKLFRLPDRKTLQEQIESFRFALLNPDQKNSEFFTQGGYSLYKQLLLPAEPFFTRKSKLVIIPDGILNYLPFEVLLTDNKGIGTGKSLSGLPYLVKKYPISYGQSASVLNSLLSEQNESKFYDPDNKKLIAFGDPIYEGTSDTTQPSIKSYKRLEYTGKEVENIASYFKKGDAEIYLRNDATEENLKRVGELKKFNYIHFATHGFIDEAKPDFSSLVLTKTNNSEEDGFLQVAEIFKLKLNADLVVLSACQTGLGKLVRGEGMVGLTRAFMYAGTPTVMVSLWSVSDNSTATLMGEFYRNLVKGKLYKTDALRKAQLYMLRNEKFVHPFYWAPFVLIGDWR